MVNPLSLIPNLLSKWPGLQLLLKLIKTRPVLDQFLYCCKDWSWNQVIVFMVVNKGCYGYYVIQSSNTKIDYYKLVTKSHVVLYLFLCWFLDVKEFYATTLKIVNKRRNKDEFKKLLDMSKKDFLMELWKNLVHIANTILQLILGAEQMNKNLGGNVCVKRSELAGAG